MSKIFLTALMMLTGLTAFGADKISVTINGQSYICSGSGGASDPEVVSVYCECTEPRGPIYLRRIAIMSDGTSKEISSTRVSPVGVSYSPDEIERKCQTMARQCR